jgi:hypothetical protein
VPGTPFVSSLRAVVLDNEQNKTLHPVPRKVTKCQTHPSRLFLDDTQCFVSLGWLPNREAVVLSNCDLLFVEVIGYYYDDLVYLLIAGFFFFFFVIVD